MDFRQQTKHIIDAHEQKYFLSDVPSAVEMVLKVNGSASSHYYDLQDSWNNRLDGLHWFHNKKICGCTFKHRFWECGRGKYFPYRDFYKCIDEELIAGRPVIISLENGPGNWCMCVVCCRCRNDYCGYITQHGRSHVYFENVKQKVQQMGGTDILVFSSHHG